MKNKITKNWFNGYKDGNEVVLEFLREMKNLDLKKEFNEWSNADEYTKLNGEIVKRYA